MNQIEKGEGGGRKRGGKFLFAQGRQFLFNVRRTAQVYLERSIVALGRKKGYMISVAAFMMHFWDLLERLDRSDGSKALSIIKDIPT